MRIPSKLEMKTIGRVVIAFAVLVGTVMAATGFMRDAELQAQASATKTFTTVSVKRSDEPINPNPNPRVGSGRIVWRGAPLIVIVR